jgi:hypothetical protein
VRAEEFHLIFTFLTKICNHALLFDITILVPALRGKDYGKTKMSYPDYTETESGLQYKVVALAFNDLYIMLTRSDLLGSEF